MLQLRVWANELLVDEPVEIAFGEQPWGVVPRYLAKMLKLAIVSINVRVAILLEFPVHHRERQHLIW